MNLNLKFDLDSGMVAAVESGESVVIMADVGDSIGLQVVNCSGETLACMLETFILSMADDLPEPTLRTLVSLALESAINKHKGEETEVTLQAILKAVKGAV